MKSAVVTARVDPATLEALDRLGKHHDRSRAWLVAEAIKRYVSDEIDLIALLDAGEEDFRRGDVVSHEDLVAEIRALRDRRDAA